MGWRLLLEQTITQRGLMSLTGSDVRLSDRTESPMRLAQRASTQRLGSRNRTSGIVGTKSHNGLQATEIALHPHLQGKEVRRVQLHREGDKW